MRYNTEQQSPGVFSDEELTPRMGSLVKDLDRFRQNADIGSQHKSQHTVLTGSKKTKSNMEKAYIIKWLSPFHLPKRLKLFFDFAPEHKTPFTSALIEISRLPEDSSVKELAALTCNLNYMELRDGLTLTDAVLHDSAISQNKAFKIARLYLLSIFLKTQGTLLTTLEYGELSSLYRRYYEDYCFHEEYKCKKSVDEKINLAEQILTVEAISGALYQFIGGTDFSPKVRILTHTTSDGKKIPVGISSKKVITYTPAREAPIETLREIAINDPRQYAKLFVSAFVLAESDLHDKNWGVDTDNQKLIKIDHDFSFFPWRGTPHFEDKGFLNSYYHHSETFAFISTWDIRNLPLVHDMKPFHFPSYKHSGNPGEFLNNLRNNPEFQHWKYFYFTKALLLTDYDIDMIIADHSIGNTELDLKLKQFIIMRLESLKSILLEMSEYREFLTYEIDQKKYNDAFEMEARSYNQENCGSTEGGSPKKEKEHRAINTAKMIESIRVLQYDAQLKEIEITKNPSSEIDYQINELLKRIQREMSLLKTNMPMSIKDKINAYLENSLCRDMAFLLNNKLDSSTVTKILEMLAKQANALSIKKHAIKEIFIRTILYQLQNFSNKEEVAALFFKSFPKHILLAIKSTYKEKNTWFKIYLAEIKKQAPDLFAYACKVMIDVLPGLNETIYNAIINNTELFDQYPIFNPDNLASKIHSAKKIVVEQLKKYRPSPGFSFFEKISLEQRTLTKCAKLLTEQTSFSYDEILFIRQLIASPSAIPELKEAFLLLFKDSIDTDLQPTQFKIYEIGFGENSTGLEMCCDIIEPSKKERVHCFC